MLTILAAIVPALAQDTRGRVQGFFSDPTAAPGGGALAGERPRVLVSTDIGGSDPDDFQSMVHFLLYADVFDVEGLVSSPWGPGRRDDILRVIDHYERDYPNLKSKRLGNRLARMEQARGWSYGFRLGWRRRGPSSCAEATPQSG